MPEPGSKVLFKNYHRQMQVPFVIYADFEAITEKIHSCNRNNQQSYTDKYQKHTGCGYGYEVVCCYNDKYSRPIQVYSRVVTWYIRDTLIPIFVPLF